MFKKPSIWLLFTCLSVAGIVFSLIHYPTVFPIVNLEIKMDRNSALDAAADIARKYNLGPKDYKQAASFIVDDDVQYYAELEVGGSEEFQKLIKEDLYSPYIWEVRHFKEGEVNESEIRFTPSGQPYGFSEWLSEDAPGASLTQDEALKIAKTYAEHFWNINLREYELIDKSQKVRPSGRVDHTFVYERPNLKVGDGRYRLSLEISGDKLTELYHYIKIPEEFFLKYKEMRSANETIGEVASYVMYFLYILIGCGFGLFYLLRKDWVLWKAPLFWGLAISLLQALTEVNNWPGEWMYYDTALSSQVFIFEKITDLTKSFLYDAFLLTISFMAAESLSRKAFPDHIQFWRIFSPGVANSKQVIGRTVSGYLLVGFDFAFLICLYFFTTKIFGWWIPSDVLINPDILATYQPWFSPIAESIKAGFWEESLCRAIPIAGAALIGQKLGNRRVWIAGALLFQAILFGALHTNYASQPSYARLVELIIPSLVYGLIYLRFGLLPCMILHFVYDAILMGLPLFISSASGIWVDRIFVIVLVLTPLWLIAYRRFSKEKLVDLKESYYNKSWFPTEKRSIRFQNQSTSESYIISSKTIKWITIGGCIGLLLWIANTNFQSDAPPISITRDQAKVIAINALGDQGISLSDSWEILSTVRILEDEKDQFIWQEGGKEAYKKLLENYLFPPVWMVRFAKFEGSITQRAEQYYVYICGDGKVHYIHHKIPDSKSGESLNEDQAREIAHSVVREKYNIDPKALKEISVESKKLPSRRDWIFIFSDQINYPLKQGDARIRIKIAGQEVFSSYRFIHVPENWSRDYQNRETLIETVADFGSNLKLAISLIIMATAIWYWSQKKFSVQAFFITFAALFSIELIGLANIWPSLSAEFSTAEPVSNQILSKISSSFYVIVLYPILYSLYVGLVQGWERPTAKISTIKTLIIGIAVGVMIEGFSSFLTNFIPSSGPTWADYEAAGSYIPIIQTALTPIKTFIILSAALLLLFTLIDKLTNNWTYRRVLFATLMIVFWLAFLAVIGDNILYWLVKGFSTGILLFLFYIIVFRFHLAIIPIVTASMAILDVLQNSIYNAHPGAIPGGAMAILLTGILSYYWYKKLTYS